MQIESRDLCEKLTEETRLNRLREEKESNSNGTFRYKEDKS